MISSDPKLPLVNGIRPLEPVGWIKEFVSRFYGLWRELQGYLIKLDSRVVTLEDFAFAAGTYTPTLTTVANLSGTHTAVVCQYLRVGKTVTVSGKFTANTITAGTTLTRMRVSLPIASDFAQDYELAGNMGNDAFDPGCIKADATNNEAEVRWYPASTTSTSKIVWFHFTYQIL